jgi:hypothetical protein
VGWAYPPFGLIAAVWAHAMRCGASICLVVPIWPTKAWWRLVVPDADGLLAPCVRKARLLPARDGLILTVDRLGNRVPKRRTNWPLVALLLDFSSRAARARIALPAL